MDLVAIEYMNGLLAVAPFLTLFYVAYVFYGFPSLCLDGHTLACVVPVLPFSVTIFE